MLAMLAICGMLREAFRNFIPGVKKGQRLKNTKNYNYNNMDLRGSSAFY